MASNKILIADDDQLVREAVAKILQFFGYKVTAVENGREVLDAVDDTFDVIILDINMPVMDGFETLAALNDRNIITPVLFLTGAGSMDYAVKAINLGAYDFLTKPINDLDLFAVKIKRAVEKKMYLLMSKAYEQNLEFEVRKKTKELEEKTLLLEQSTIDTITSLQVALEEKDQYTAGHTKRVTEYGVTIGRAIGLSAHDMKALYRACQIHDIGKLVIDVSCIQKPGPLTSDEWERVKKHPEVGHNIVKPLAFLEREGKIIRHHHERMDGNGYPARLAGSDIDPLTRILTVADSYDAMTSMRSYKVNKSMAEAIEELYNCAGSQFDKEVVRVFAKVLLEGEAARPDN